MLFLFFGSRMCYSECPMLYSFFPVPLTPVDVIIGCSTDSECPEYAACINSACRNPCILSDPCAPNAFCKVIYHTPKCACPAGYLGDPQIECKLPPRKNNCSIEIHFFKRLDLQRFGANLGIESESWVIWEYVVLEV